MRRLSTPSFVILSVVLFLIVVISAGILGLNQIERDIRSRAVDGLREAGVDDAAVVVDGLDVTLFGSVDVRDAGAAQTIVEGVRGVRSIDNQLTIIGADLATIERIPEVRLSWTRDSVVVEGALSDDSVKNRVISVLDSTFALPIDSAGLEVASAVADPGPWLDSLLELVPLLADELEEGGVVVNVEGRVFILNGEVEGRDLWRSLGETADDLFGPSYAGVNAIGIIEPELPPPDPVQVEELQEDLTSLLEGKTVEFETASAVLTPAGRELLDEIAVALNIHPNIPVEIAGHADSVGTEEYNFDLALRRAEAVLTYLASVAVDPARLRVMSYGESQPIADNSTAEGRAQNRRIEFIALEE